MNTDKKINFFWDKFQFKLQWNYQKSISGIPLLRIQQKCMCSNVGSCSPLTEPV